ncbi:MAG: tetratricopeptide repeat protein [Nannocystaceae bacterium]
MFRSSFIAHSLVLMALAACHKAGGAGEALRPDAARASDAMGEADIAVCTSAAVGQPFVVDLKSSERSDLEVAMRDGVVAVRYDCKSLEILQNCTAPGEYRYAGVTRKEDLLRMNGADEIAANLPLRSARISAGMKRGSTFDLALVTVGKRRSAAREIALTDLGGSRCEGATHVVRGVYVGAFAMATGTEGEVQAIAQIFTAGVSAGSSSDKQAQTRDGDLTACRTATADAAQPPAECAAITRLELVPLVAQKRTEPAPDGEAEAEATCPADFAWDGLKCVSKAKGRVVQPCDRATSTKEQCQAACESGSADSCYDYVILKDSVEEVGPEGQKYKMRYTALDETDIPLLDRACAGGSAFGCHAASRYYRDYARKHKDSPELEKPANEKAAARLEHACSFGDAPACVMIASNYDPNTGASPMYVKSTDKLVVYTKRACDLGSGNACGKLGDMHRDGKGVKQDEAAALAAYERQCSAGGFSDGQGCRTAGALVVARDPRRALKYFERACDLRSALACMDGFKLALEFQETATARALLEGGCNDSVAGWAACPALGEAYEKGTLGLQKDFALAAKAYQRVCREGHCTHAGDLYTRGGPNLAPSPEKALAAYTGGCDAGDLRGCDMVEAHLKRKDPDGLTLFYKKRCLRHNSPDACVKWKAAGGEPRPEELPTVAWLAQRACQDEGSGQSCRLWKELGGNPTAKELAQRDKPAKKR